MWAEALEPHSECDMPSPMRARMDGMAWEQVQEPRVREHKKTENMVSSPLAMRLASTSALK